MKRFLELASRFVIFANIPEPEAECNAVVELKRIQLDARAHHRDSLLGKARQIEVLAVHALRIGATRIQRDGATKRDRRSLPVVLESLLDQSEIVMRGRNGTVEIERSFQRHPRLTMYLGGGAPQPIGMYVAAREPGIRFRKGGIDPDRFLEIAFSGKAAALHPAFTEILTLEICRRGTRLQSTRSG